MVCCASYSSHASVIQWDRSEVKKKQFSLDLMHKLVDGADKPGEYGREQHLGIELLQRRKA